MSEFVQDCKKKEKEVHVRDNNYSALWRGSAWPLSWVLKDGQISTQTMKGLS